MQNKRSWDLLNTAFLLGTLGLALVLVPLTVIRGRADGATWLVFGVMLLAAGLGVTAGYHRLFSHRAYTAVWPVRFVLLCLGAAAFQNSILHWASDHRIHHRNVDEDKDPYNINRGFWYAHWLWVMESAGPEIAGVADLEKDPLVQWQHRNIFLIGAVATLVLPVTVGLATGNLWGHLVIGVLLRIVVSHHTTFFINSAAHVFGTRPYTDANSARDNILLAPLTYGEGYHNYHHMWQWDYRNGVKWYHFDPTKWLIWSLHALGLAANLRRVPAPAIRRARLAMEEKRLLARLEKAGNRAEAMRAQVREARARLDAALGGLQEQLETWEARKAEWKAEKAGAWAARKAEWRAARDRCRADVRSAFLAWKAARLAARKLAYA